MKRNSLEAMPDMVMAKILENSNYVEIQSLRKSCSRLRKLVDLTKPSPKVKSIMCIFNDTAVTISLTYLDGQSTNIFYLKTAGGCDVQTSQDHCVSIKNTPIDEVVFEDFKILKSSLTHQPTPLHDLTLVFKEDSVLLFYDSVYLALAARPFIRVTTLHLRPYSSFHLALILMCVSAESLKKLTMDTTVDERYAHNLNWVGMLEQWKSLQSLKFLGALRIHDLSILETIPSSAFRMDKIYPFQVERLKEVFLNSPTFSFCSIELDDVSNRLDSLSSIIPDIEEDPGETWWFFKSHRPGKVFRVGHEENKLTFVFVDVANLEEEDLVRD